MVEQNRSGVCTQIVYGPLGNKLALMNGQTLSKGFVGLPGGATAVYTWNNSSAVLSYYRHADWLGSSRLDSSSSQAVIYQVAYGPYGEPYDESGTTDRNFTGQNQDTVGDMYDFLYREYHEIQGRWILPDPAGLAAANVTNPQSLNRYAYVTNNPTRFVDLLGLSAWPCGCGMCPSPGPPTPGLTVLLLPGQEKWQKCQEALAQANKNTSALDRLDNYWGVIQQAAVANGVDPAILGAMAIVESNVNPNMVQANGLQGRGMFSIDLGQHPEA